MTSLRNHPVAQLIVDAGLVTIIRARDVTVADLVATARALAAGGVRCMEVTLNTPGALEAVEAIAREVPGVCCGAGTILSADDALRAVSAGARFIVTPALDLETVKACRRMDSVIVPGCVSPGEALAAARAGAEFVKVFPANRFGLTDIAEILEEMPALRLVPTGGVTPANCRSFFEVGCPAVAVGSNLISAKDLAARDWGAIERAARVFTEAVGRARELADGL